jgi:TnpA family transposase
MPRRRVLTDAQLEGLLALPVAEPDLIRHWTLSPAEIAAIQRRRRDRNRLGFALQLCALRYPGRLLRSGECIPPPALCYVAHQLDADPEALAADTWPALAPFIAGRIDTKLIEAHWDDLLRLAASVRTGVVSASLMLRRLGAYPRQNGLALV